MDSTVLDTLARQATDLGSKTAVSDNQRAYSYSQLWEYSNYLALELNNLGLKKGDRAVVLLSPCADLIVVMLALFKLGVIYIPLDNSFPEARIKSKLSFINPKLVFADDAAVSNVSDTAIELISRQQLDLLLANIADADESVTNNKRETIKSKDLSHAFFTSGTTGNSKGVLSDHQALNCYINSAQNKFQFTSQDTFIALARPSFSISLFEILLPLCTGASVIIVDRREIMDTPNFVKKLSQCTVAHIGPGLLKQLVNYLNANPDAANGLQSIQHLSSGGDLVSQELLTAASNYFSQAEIFILYGSSEINCMGTCYDFHPDHSHWLGKVGKAMAPMQVRIVDDNGAEMPTGEVGNVQFSGPGLATGYLDAPELTQQRFKVIDGTRWYDMGDMGFIDAGDELSLRGRSDFQVKVRGMRVEILEVEATAREFYGVKECIVSNKLDPNTESQRLTAYLLLEEPDYFDLAAFKQHLKDLLPNFMIPSAFVKLEQLPLNANLKIDRKALPDITDGNRLREPETIQELDQEEQKVSSILNRILASNHIDKNSDFFELGLDSLSAAIVLADINREFDNQLTIKDLLECPTVFKLARRAKTTVDPSQQAVIELQAGDPALPPIIFVSGSVNYLEFARALNVKNRILALNLDDWVEILIHGKDSNYFKDSENYDYIVERYYEQITHLGIADGSTLCGFSFGGLIALGVAKKLEERGVSLSSVALIDTHTPNYFDTASLVKRGLKKMVDLENYAVIQMAEKLQLLANLFLVGSHFRRIVFKDLHLKKLHIARLKACKTLTIPELKSRVVIFRAKTRSFYDPGLKDLGWSKVIPNVEVYDVEGVHMKVMRGDKAFGLSQEFRKALIGLACVIPYWMIDISSQLFI